MRSSIATTKNSASPVPASIKSLAGQGYQAPAIPAVGRMYYNGEGWCSGTLIYVGVVRVVLAQINGTTLSTRSLQNVDPGAMPAPG